MGSLNYSSEIELLLVAVQYSHTYILKLLSVCVSNAESNIRYVINNTMHLVIRTVLNFINHTVLTPVIRTADPSNTHC